MKKISTQIIPNSFKSYFEKGTERSQKAKRNIFFSFLIKILNILTGLILVPLTIHYVDQTTYGIWLTLSSIIGWFGFFDIGFANGLRNKLSEAIAAKKFLLARIYVSTTYFVLGLISLIILLVFLLVNPFINWPAVLNTSGELRIELQHVATIVVTFFCMQFVMQIITVIFNANQQPARAALMNFLGNLLALFVIAALIYLKPGSLFWLSLAQGLAPVAVLAASSFIFFRTRLKQFRPSYKLVRMRFAKPLMDLGVKFFVIQFAFIVLYQTSNIIIAQLFTPKEVTPYNIVFKYFAVIPMLFSIVISPFWSAFTDAWFKQDKVWIESIMQKLRRVWLGMIVLVLLMVLFSKLFYRFWVGSEVIIPPGLTLAMAVYVLVNAFNAIYSQFLNGVGIVNLQLILSIVGSVINVPLSIFLCRSIGIYGVVVSTSIVCLPGLLLYPIQYHKLINRSATGIWAR